MTQDRPLMSAEELNSLRVALDKCNYAQLIEVRTALDSRAAAIKSDIMAQAEAMGLACSDENGKPKRKRRANAHKEAD